MRMLATLPMRLGLAAMTLAVGGCDKSTLNQGESGENSATVKQLPTEGSQVLVELVSAGAEPRQALRLTLSKGAKAKAELRMTMNATNSIGGIKQPSMKLPVMRTVLDAKVSAAGDGVFSFDWVVLDYVAEDTPGVMPQLVSALKAQLKQLVGAKGSGKLDSQGRNLGATFEVPPGVGAQLKQTMNGMRDAITTISAPLPAEPVGVGGAWRVTQPMNQNGVASTVEATYTVEEIDGDRVTLRTSLKTSGQPGPIDSGGMMPAGTQASLESMSGSGTGRIVLDLSSPLPRSSTTEITTNTETRMSANGTTQAVSTVVMLKADLKVVR